MPIYISISLSHYRNSNLSPNKLIRILIRTAIEIPIGKWTINIFNSLDTTCVTTAMRTVREVTADSPRGVAQIFIWMVVGPTCHFSLPPLFFQSRADLVPSPQRSPSPSISLLRPPNLDSSCRNLPRHLLHLPQTLDRLLPGRNRPHYRRTPLEVLEVCSTVDPPLQSSSTRTDRGNGFVVSSLCFTAFFPFPWRVAGAGARPPPLPPPLLPPRAWVRN